VICVCVTTNPRFYPTDRNAIQSVFCLAAIYGGAGGAGAEEDLAHRKVAASLK